MFLVVEYTAKKNVYLLILCFSTQQPVCLGGRIPGSLLSDCALCFSLSICYYLGGHIARTLECKIPQKRIKKRSASITRTRDLSDARLNHYTTEPALPNCRIIIVNLRCREKAIYCNYKDTLIFVKIR